MPISTTTNRVAFTGNGVTVAFSYPYYFLADADLVIIETVITTGVQSTKVLTTDYSVTGAGDENGGTVTAVTAPAGTVTWTIFRDPAITQTVELVDNDPLPAASLNLMPDKLTMIAQRTRELVARSLGQPDGDTADIARIPAKVDRASMLHGYDGDGDPIAVDPATLVAGEAIVSAFGATLVDDVDAATARATLVAAGTGVANTFTADQTIQSTDAGATEAPLLILDRNSASPAANDLIGAVPFKGRSSTAVTRTFAKLLAQILDATNASEDAIFALQTIVAGTLATRLTVGQGLQIGTPTGGDKGAGTLNMTSTPYVNGVKINSFYRATYEVASGATGEAYTAAAWRKVSLNTESSDPDSIGALASSQITLAAGTYLLRGAVTVYQGSSSRARLYNATAAALIAAGPSMIGAGTTGSVAIVDGIFVANGTDAIELDLFPLATTTAQPAISTGANEVFAELTAIRIG